MNVAWTALTVAPLLLAALAGCTDEDSCRTTHTEGPKSFAVPANAPAVGGEGGNQVLRIFVTSEAVDGPPLAGVPVIVFAPRTFETKTECDSGRVIVDTYTEYVPLASLRTGADGRVEAHVNGSQVVGIAVGASPGHHPEERLNVALDSSGREAEFHVPLYKTQLPFAAAGEWATSVGLPTERRWAASPVAFSGDETAQRIYMQRLARLDANLTWDNGPLANADLYLGLGLDAAPPFHEGRNQRIDKPTDTGNRETLTAFPEQLEPQRAAFTSTSALTVAAMSEYPSVALKPLPYEIRGQGIFQHDVEFEAS